MAESGGFGPEIQTSLLFELEEAGKKLPKDTRVFHRRTADPMIAMEVTVTMYTSVSPVKLDVSQQLDGYSLTVPSLIGPFFRPTVQHTMPVKLRVPPEPADVEQRE